MCTQDFWFHLKAVGPRIQVHSGNVEGANSTVKHIIHGAQNCCHSTVSSRAQLMMQCSDALAHFSSGTVVGSHKWSHKKETIETLISDVVDVDSMIDDVLGDVERWKTPEPLKTRKVAKPVPDDAELMQFLGMAHRRIRFKESIFVCYLLESSLGDLEAFFCPCTHYDVGLLLGATILDISEDNELVCVSVERPMYRTSSVAVLAAIHRKFMANDDTFECSIWKYPCHWLGQEV